ncbi:MAG: carboxypeptidase-like regulatory domain-containing protein [candidate division Zixibacteria bacterium]|nr:carboxypeptidase-like regulatory domain-containing protein [candidate division Zixibacteria bacterium]
MKTFSVFFVLAFVLSGAVFSNDIDNQNSLEDIQRCVLSGTVYDSTSGKPLPHVTVQPVGTGFASKTNREGKYRLILPAGIYTIKASHIGHYSLKKNISIDSISITTDFILRTSIIDLGVRKVYSRAYSPAQKIILEAIANKKDILSKISDYQFDAYTKVVINDNTLPDTAESDILLIAETQITSFWERPDKYKEIINSRKQTSNIPPEGNLVSVGELLNFNKNRIDLTEHSVVSPTADDALEHYNYYLIDTVYLDDKPVFVLEIEPKNEYEPLFKGEIHIADSTYEVVRVDVGFSKGMDDPVMKNARYYQHYAEINSEYWMPIEIGFSCNLHLGLGIMGIPSDIGLLYIASLSDYKIEDGHSKNRFDDFVLEVAPTADDFDSTIWATRLIIPLTRDEERGYTYIDSVVNAPKPLLKTASRVALGAVFMTLFGDRDMIHFNRVDGFYFGLPIKISPTPNIKLRAINGYGLKEEKWNFEYGLDYRLSLHQQLWLGGSVKNRNVARRSITLPPNLNETFGALLSGIDPNIYYQEKGFELHGSIKVLKKTRLSIGFNHFDYASRPMRTDYTTFGDRNEVQDNIPITEGSKRSVSAAIRFDSRPLINDKGRIRIVPTSKYIKGIAGIEYSSPDFGNSDFDFKRYFAQVEGQFKLLGLGTTSIFGFAGASDGNLPVQSRFVASYMDWIIYQTMGLITFPDTSFVGDRMAYLFAEHDFGKFMFRNSGINFLKQIPVGFSIHGGVMWSEYKNRPMIPTGEIGLIAPQVYSEIGFGLHNLTPWLGIFNLSTKLSWQLSDYKTKDFNFSINFFDF